MSTNARPQTRHWAYLIVLAIIWGSSFILMKRGMDALSFDQVAALRIFITFLAVLPVYLIRFKSIQKKHILPAAFVGIVGSMIPAFLFTLAETQIDSAVAGILNSFTPLAVLIIGILLFGANWELRKLLGLLLGLVGTAFLIYGNSTSQMASTHWYALLIVLASICYGFSVNVIKRFCQDIQPLTLTALAFMFIGPITGVYVFSTDLLTVMQSNPLAYASLAYTAILALAGTALASVIFFRLTQETSPIFASTVTYLQPIVALFWGFMASELIAVSHIMAMGLILLGVYIVSR